MPKARMRILAIEPEAAWRDNLRRLLAERIFADVVLVSSPDAAAAAMRNERPDLLLVSAVMPPKAEAQIMKLLTQLDPYGTVPVLTIPPVVQPMAEQEAERRFFSFLSRRARPALPSYDPGAVAARIGETLTQLRSSRASGGVRRRDLAAACAAAEAGAPMESALQPREPVRALALVKKTAPLPLPQVVTPQDVPSLVRTRHRRAHRLESDELPWPCVLTTPRGVAVRLLNVSTTGVLFESPLKFTPNSETSLYLSGPDTKLVLPARFVRSEVSVVDAAGVKYQTAAMFSHQVKLFAALSRSKHRVEPTSQALADLLVRVTTEFAASNDAAVARHEFERGLAAMVPACAITLRDELIRPADGGDSIYFTVPSAKGAILQVTFDPEQEPSLEDFKVLRAAAALASVIVQYESMAATARTA
jgi:CheY-like chemotaxis protein